MEFSTSLPIVHVTHFFLKSKMKIAKKSFVGGPNWMWNFFVCVDKWVLVSAATIVEILELLTRVRRTYCSPRAQKNINLIFFFFI